MSTETEGTALPVDETQGETAAFVPPPPGKILVDADGKLIGVYARVEPDGESFEAETLPPAWHYRWINGEWVEGELPEAPAPVLDAPRFEYLLAFTGLDDVWDALFAALRETDRAAYAALKAQRAKGQFHLDVTLALVGQYRDAAQQTAPDADLSEGAIRAAWDMAATVEI